MKYVYLVYGETGEYADRKEWFVAGYLAAAQAQKHVSLANARLRELGMHTEQAPVLIDLEKNPYGHGVPSEMGDLDPGCACDYTGTSYDVAKVPLLRVVPRCAIEETEKPRDPVTGGGA